jgi:hypothetical protein
MVILFDIAIDSPFIKHNFLLSSKTVFIFSIQSAVTGPSNTIIYRSGDTLAAHDLKIFARIPSDHSLEIGSEYPYSSFIETALGLITK